MPTLGGANRAIMELQGRVLQLEQAKRNGGSAFTDEQTKQMNAIAKEQADQSFNRLVKWTALAAFSGGASVVLAYLKIRG